MQALVVQRRAANRTLRHRQFSRAICRNTVGKNDRPRCQRFDKWVVWIATIIRIARAAAALSPRARSPSTSILTMPFAIVAGQVLLTASGQFLAALPELQRRVEIEAALFELLHDDDEFVARHVGPDDGERPALHQRRAGLPESAGGDLLCGHGQLVGTPRTVADALEFGVMRNSSISAPSLCSALAMALSSAFNTMPAAFLGVNFRMLRA